MEPTDPTSRSPTPTSGNKKKYVGGDVTPGARDDTGGDAEGDVWLTYRELAARLGITVLSAQSWVQRAGWRRRVSNYGIARVAVPHHVLHPVREDVAPDITPDAGDDADMMYRLLGQLESLEAELREAREAATAAALATAIARTERDAENRRATVAEARAAFLSNEIQEVQALANLRAEEVARLRERTGRVEAGREAADTARQLAEAAATRAERRLEVAEAALYEARLPWHERLARVVQAFRGRG